MLPGTTPTQQQPGNSRLPCPVDYRTHFVQTYTKSKTSVVAARRTQDLLNYAIAFGSLAQQETAWPRGY
jgi:hypothetical protein